VVWIAVTDDVVITAVPLAAVLVQGTVVVVSTVIVVTGVEEAATALPVPEAAALVAVALPTAEEAQVTRARLVLK